MMSHLFYVTTDIWEEARILQSIEIGELHVVKPQELEVIMDSSVMASNETKNKNSNRGWQHIAEEVVENRPPSIGLIFTFYIYSGGETAKTSEHSCWNFH